MCELWFVDEGRLLGIIQIRYHATGIRPNFDSNVYYAIRPKYRRNGFGTQLLARGVKAAKKMGFKKIAVACDCRNVASKKIIEHNAGVLIRTSRRAKSCPNLLYEIQFSKRPIRSR
jgi:predicted acetyltransferase